jgi:hypothetical protein
VDGVTVMRRADELGAISEEPGILVRTFGWDAMRRANELLPAESVNLADVEVAIDVLQRFVARLAEIEAKTSG